MKQVKIFGKIATMKKTVENIQNYCGYNWEEINKKEKSIKKL